MWIDYIIGIVAIVIVILVVLKCIFNFRNKKKSKFSCGGNCSRCKYNLNDENLKK